MEFPDHIKSFDIEVHSLAWHKFRENGLGSSEIGVVQGLNPYETAMALYHRKVGDHTQADFENNLMFWGTQHEDKILEIWQYYDGSEFGYIDNFKNKQRIRTAYSPRRYYVNDKYPWLFSSPDGLSSDGFNIVTSESLDKMIVECKTMTFWAGRVWEGGIPPYHILQVQQQMLVMEIEYAEIAVLMDGNKFAVYPIEANKSIQEQIVKSTKNFWFNHVIPAKEAFAQLGELSVGQEEEWGKFQAIIDRHEPEPDESEAYKQYTSDHFNKERDSIEGEVLMFRTAQRHKFVSKIIDKLGKVKSLYSNILTNEHKKNGTEFIDFETMGHTKYFKKEGGKNFQLDNRVKLKFDDADLESEILKLNLNRKF